jgi:ribonuclease HII
LELDLYSRGFHEIAGIDEAGRGPLAGPVVAASVILPIVVGPGFKPAPTSWLSLVDDSKKLTPLQREKALAYIEAHAIGMGIGMATPEEIDSMGIGEATRRAMLRAVEDLPVGPSHLLIDYVQLPECGIPFKSLPRGDSLSYSIAAASIVAKVTRDRLMEVEDRKYPDYGFASHKGYGTRRHLDMLALLGPCFIHRRSFKPVADVRLSFRRKPESRGGVPR